MRAPRVLMTADAVGGVWTYALDLAAALGAHIEITLAVLGPAPSAAQRRQAQSIPGLVLVETGLPLDWMAVDPAQIDDAGDGIRQLARASGADLIHLNSPALAGGGGFSAPVLGVCHSCLATWWAAVKDGPMPADLRWRTRAQWRGMLACRALIAPSASFAAALSRAYETPPPEVVHNGREPAAAARIRTRDRVVFTAGRLWDEGKNIAVLDAAAALSSVEVWAAGPLEEPGGANRATLDHGRPLGSLTAAEVAHRLARTPVYASGALYEPFGLGVLEAAQAGCALVLSDIPTFRELWDGAAVFVDPASAAGFAGAFEFLFADEAALRRIGGLARARARRFTVQAMADGVLAAYQRLGVDGVRPPLGEAAA